MHFRYHAVQASRAGPVRPGPRALVPAALAMLLLAVPLAQAAPVCTGPDARGVSACGAALDAGDVVRMRQQQERPRWCWAAVISMVLARWGHAVPQSEIVERMYGQPADLGLPTHVLPAVIAREWRSGQGAFAASARVQEAAPGATVPASAALLISSLAEGRPLILSAGGHAVVVVAVTYEQRGGALRLTGGTVLDPQPGVGLRALRRDELGVALLASIDVVPAPRRSRLEVASLAADALPH